MTPRVRRGSSGKFIVCGKTSTEMLIVMGCISHLRLEDRSHILSHFQCTTKIISWILQDKVNVRDLKALYSIQTEFLYYTVHIQCSSYQFLFVSSSSSSSLLLDSTNRSFPPAVLDFVCASCLLTVMETRVEKSLKPKSSVQYAVSAPCREMVWILESGVKTDNIVPLSRSHMLTASVQQIIQRIEWCIPYK